MIALSVSDVSLSFGTDVILKNISFSINDGDRLGIIGVNGAGKTSLLRVISGVYTPDSGSVFLQKGHTLGVLEQNPDLEDLPSGMTSLEYMYTAFASLIELEGRIADTERQIAALSDEGLHDDAVRLSGTLDELNRKFAEGGGMEFRSRCRGMLARLGFEESLLSKDIRSLSGGQFTRLALARLLAIEPDVLMLDEPTNHLDIDALGWLEGFISSYKKTVVIISHDRYFLDRTTSKTLQILHKCAKLYNGNYSASKAQQEADAASLEHRYKEQQKQIAKIKANIEFQRRCGQENNFVTIRSKEKQLERMEKIELGPRAPRDIRLSFLSEEQSAGDVLTAQNLCFSYNGEPLIEKLSFLIRRYERVMFLGKNGTGKSTLMKLINSQMKPTGGKLTLGYNIKIGYYDQQISGLCETNTVFDEMRAEYPNKTDLELRETLALFLFGQDDITKPISALSGGERARVVLAKLILKKVNLLILDEPTNHLDIGSAEALENALLAFDGTIIAVSHDRYFINRIATRIIELDPTCERGMTDYSLNESDDAYTEYMRIRDARAARLAAESAAMPKQVSDTKLDYEERKRIAREKRQQERKIENAKARIAELEAELEELSLQAQGDAAFDYVRLGEIEKRREAAEEELLSLYEIVM